MSTRKAMPALILSCMAGATDAVDRHRATKALSIIDPGQSPPNLACEQMTLRFHDVITGAGQSPHWIEPPMGGHIARIIAFGRALSSDDRCVVHCHAGISRSPAALLIIAAARTHSVNAALSALAAADPAGTTAPNSRMIAMADRQLELRGALSAAAAAICDRHPPARAISIW